MPELSNQDLDNLFQRGSERYEFEFNPEAWHRMEALLDRRRRRILLWWWLFGAGTAVLLLLGGYCYLKDKDGKEAKGIQADRVTGVDSGATGSVHSREGISPLSSGTTDSAERTKPRRAGSISRGLRQADPTSGRLQQIDSSSRGFRRAGPPSGTLRRAEGGQTVIKERDLKETKPGFPETGLLSPQRQEHDTPKSTKAPAGLADSSASETIIAANVSPKSDAPLLPFRQDTLQLAEPRPEIAVRQSLAQPSLKAAAAGGLLISLNGAPQVSSVGPDNPGPGSLRLGMGLEYRFGRRWAIGTGVYRVKKRYTAGEGEYIPPKGFWVRQIAPEYSVGWCDVLELPVYGAFYPSGHHSNSFFLEAGITSLYMREEWYYYHYRQNDPDLIHYWEGRNAHHAWLSLLQFSPGYQLAVGKPWRIQVAPYIQLPLVGVGHGSLSLYSMGLNARIGFFRTGKGNQ